MHSRGWTARANLSCKQIQPGATEEIKQSTSPFSVYQPLEVSGSPDFPFFTFRSKTLLNFDSLFIF